MRSTPIFKILSAAVLAAVVVLLGVQTYRYFHRPLSVSAAYTSQVSDSISVTGWVVRQEAALPEASGTLLRQVREGEKVHAGQTVAVSYASKSALETVKELEDTELKLQQLQFARSSFLDSDAALRMDESGQLGVYCQIGAYVYLKPVDLIYKGSGFCLVQRAEGASGERALRQGDLVISTAQQLTDGMILPDS